MINALERTFYHCNYAGYYDESISEMSIQEEYPYQNRSLENMAGEIWKDIAGFEGYYQASSLGRVKSLNRLVPHTRWKNRSGQLVAGRVLSQSLSKNKNIKTGDSMIDLRVSLNLEGKQYYFNTRRVIYKTFIGPDLDYGSDGLYVINVDGNGYNNQVGNLAMVTKSEKQKRVFVRERFDSTLKTADRSNWTKTYGSYALRKPVDQYLDGQLIKHYESISEAARQTGFDEKSIIMVARKRWKQYKGFVWKYHHEDV